MTNFKDALDRIEADIAEVKRQYDLFFQGARRTEPMEERRMLEWMVRRMGQKKFPMSADQFRFAGLQSRFYAYLNLWNRMVRDFEEGRLTRDRGSTGVRKKSAGPEPVDPEHLDKVMEILKNARKECGLPTEEKDLDSYRQILLARASELAEKAGARRVEFRVTIEGGKPKIKAGLR